MTVVITLPVLPSPIDELWHAMLDLNDRLDVPWSLVGGQMVLLHALEHGEVPPQVSQDGDVIADIRAVPGALKQVVEYLEDMGFHCSRSAPRESLTATSGRPFRGRW